VSTGTISCQVASSSGGVVDAAGVVGVAGAAVAARMRCVIR